LRNYLKADFLPALEGRGFPSLNPLPFVINISFLMPRSKYTHMRIVKDKDGERFLEFESKEDLEEFRKMLIEAYYELNLDRKRPCETRSPK